jgi:hypothetical protein
MKFNINMHFRGPELARGVADRAMTSIVRKLVEREEAEAVDEDCTLTLWFCVSGSLGRCPFEGIQIDGFSRKRKTVVAKAAVPDGMSDPQELQEFMFDSLREAARLAQRKFDRAKIPYSVEEQLAFVDRVEASMREHDDAK